MGTGPSSVKRTIRRRSVAALAAVAVVMVVLASGCVLNGTWTQLPSGGAVGACVTDTWCMGYGGPTGIAVWNGSTWTSRPAPAAAVSTVTARVQQIECFAILSFDGHVQRLRAATPVRMRAVGIDQRRGSNQSGTHGFEVSGSHIAQELRDLDVVGRDGGRFRLQ